MTILNHLPTADKTIAAPVAAEGVSILLRLLSPIAPHICHSLWNELADQNILSAPWPKVDSSALTLSSIELVVQVNGKVRAKIKMAADTDKATLESTALAHENVQKFIEDKTVRKVIVIPGKLINIVAN